MILDPLVRDWLCDLALQTWLGYLQNSLYSVYSSFWNVHFIVFIHWVWQTRNTDHAFIYLESIQISNNANIVPTKYNDGPIYGQHSMA